MEIVYKGFDICVSREKCLAGYKLLYFSVFRKSDGYELISSYTEGSDTVREYIGYMKDRVDGFLDDPRGEVLQDAHEDEEEYAENIKSHIWENEKTQRLFPLNYKVFPPKSA